MKYYFDTTALVKIYHREIGSDQVIGIYNGEDAITISELGAIEFISTIHRKHREHEVDMRTLMAVISKFQEDMDNRYDVVKFFSLVMEEAWNFICNYAPQHSLRTLDSLQFAFFKVYCDPNDTFVCADKNLIKLVNLAGFTVLAPQ
jgi:predicted nucleic acid-binding protein